MAERKTLALIRSGADVSVVSPSLTKRLLKEKTQKKIKHISRNFRGKDIKGAFLVIAATDSPEVNAEIAAKAPALVNVVDVPSQCNFIAPSVIKRGALTIAISTRGNSPALSRAIRKDIEESYGPQFSEYLKFVKALRAKSMAEIKDKKKREKYLKSLASEKILRAIKSGDLDTIKKVALERFRRSAGC